MSKRVTCDSCAVLVVNGTVCHERGCPNSKRARVKRVKDEVRITREVTYRPGLGRFAA